MKVAAYLRVSTEEQTFENQLPAIEQWCESRGYGKPVIYAENESAWKNGHQKELARLLKDIRNGKPYNYLLVWSLDRLSRQGIASVLQLISSFDFHGCQVVSLQESWTDQTGPMRELFIAIAAWAGKFESDRRSERTKAGMTRAKAQGKHIGRPAGAKDKKQRKLRGK